MSELRVYLVGEGPNDIGDLAREAPYRRGRDGFLQPVLRTMFAPMQLAVDGLKLTSLPRLERRPVSADEFQARNAEKALALAARSGAEVLVFSCDLDKTSGTSASNVERRRRLEALRMTIERGFQAVVRVNPKALGVRTAVAIPCRMIESWALADREALARLLGKHPRELTYGPVEELWGKQDAEGSDHPKQVWRRVTEARIHFDEIGAAISPRVLSKACPLSFPPFQHDVDAAQAASSGVEA